MVLLFAGSISICAQEYIWTYQLDELSTPYQVDRFDNGDLLLTGYDFISNGYVSRLQSDGEVVWHDDTLFSTISGKHVYAALHQNQQLIAYDQKGHFYFFDLENFNFIEHDSIVINGVDITRITHIKKHNNQYLVLGYDFVEPETGKFYFVHDPLSNTVSQFNYRDHSFHATIGNENRIYTSQRDEGSVQISCFDANSANQWTTIINRPRLTLDGIDFLASGKIAVYGAQTNEFNQEQYSGYAGVIDASTGALLWDRVIEPINYDGEENAFSVINCVTELENGQYLIAGGDGSREFQISTNLRYDLLDSNGNEIWHRTVEEVSAFGTLATDITKLDNGDVLISGTSHLMDNAIGTSFYIRIDPQISGTIVQSSLPQTATYPTPASDLVNFHLPARELYSLHIYSINGKEVLALRDISSQSRINISSLNNGKYIALLQNNKGTMIGEFVKGGQ